MGIRGAVIAGSVRGATFMLRLTYIQYDVAMNEMRLDSYSCLNKGSDGCDKRVCLC